MSELKQILINAKLTQKSIRESLVHPVLQTTDYTPREIFGDLKEIVATFFTTRRTFRMIGLAGLRGTGKSTLLWQIAQHIFGHYEQNMYFFNIAFLRKYDIGIREIHEGFREKFDVPHLWNHRQQVVLLFDEVHEDPDWAVELKILHDEFPTAFVVATGSSALLLQSTADLVTRMLIEHVFPLGFSEYLHIIKPQITQQFSQQKALKEVLFHSNNVDELYQNLQPVEKEAVAYYSTIEQPAELIRDYIQYRNITRFTLFVANLQIERGIADLVRRVIYEDIPKAAQTPADALSSEKILRRLAGSDEVNIQTLSQALGISQDKIAAQLETLEKAELLNALLPFGGIDSKLNKAQKYFFMSPSIRRVLLTPLVGTAFKEDLYAKMLEDTVVMYLKRLFRQDSVLSFVSQKKGKNPDLIIETLPAPVVMETGINKQSGRQIVQSNIPYKYGIIINATTNKITVNKTNKLLILPLSYFLLL